MGDRDCTNQEKYLCEESHHAPCLSAKNMRWTSLYPSELDPVATFCLRMRKWSCCFFTNTFCCLSNDEDDCACAVNIWIKHYCAAHAIGGSSEVSLSLSLSSPFIQSPLHPLSILPLFSCRHIFNHVICSFIFSAQAFFFLTVKLQSSTISPLPLIIFLVDSNNFFLVSIDQHFHD